MKKTILITGCSSGIGLATALALNERGYHVIASCRNEHDIASIKDKGIEHVIHLDVTSSTSIDNAIEQTLKLSNGQLFALFNNAGFGQVGAIEDITREALREQFETNVFGAHELIQKLMPFFLQQPTARIIQHSSILGFVGMPFRGAYNASKFALEGLSDTLRLELRNTNIHISLIEPGPILSEFRKNALQALKDNVDINQSRHQALYEENIRRLEKKGAAVPFTEGPEAVVKRVIHALESQNPQARYYVTKPTYVLGFLKRILPTFLFDKIVQATSKA